MNLLIYMYRIRLLEAKGLGKFLWNFDRKGFSEIYVISLIHEKYHIGRSSSRNL